MSGAAQGISYQVMENDISWINAQWCKLELSSRKWWQVENKDYRSEKSKMRVKKSWGQFGHCIKEVRNSPCSAGRRTRWAAACSRTAAAPRAPASLPRAGPAAGPKHLLTGESASGGRNLSAGSSGTLRTRRGIATSFSASRAERTSNRTAEETVSSVDRASAPAGTRGPNQSHPRWMIAPLISGVRGGDNRLWAGWSPATTTTQCCLT